MLKKPPKIQPKYFGIIILFLIGVTIPIVRAQNTSARTCLDLRVIFARGSGNIRNEDQNFQAFRSTIESKLQTTSLSYDFLDLDYPAVSIGFNNLLVSIGALVSGGDSFTFGESVNSGVESLLDIIDEPSCPNTKYVLGGYSQGAMVISKAIHSISARKIIYAATFGDPKLFLPEGDGDFPLACIGLNISDYRTYVPDCYTFNGLLGGYDPYEPYGYTGKLGTWCNKYDIICSAHWNVSDHRNYVSDNLYEDASRVIFNKITEHFKIKNTITSPHDTAILIDSTGSMEGMINEYKNEAYRLAIETLNSGGRVALYDYRDLEDPYEPKEHCNFNTCTIEKFSEELDNIQVDGGGDEPESLLSASLHVMNNLEWKQGSTKSIIVLTDADYHTPDLDGVSLNDVIDLSRSIDPVNFYIITNNAEPYQELAYETDGKVITNFGELSLLTDYIMNRFDSLPKVELSNKPTIKSTLEIKSAIKLSNTEYRLEFETDADQVLVILNDAPLGITTEKVLTFTEINYATQNHIRLIPIKNELKGEPTEIFVSAEKDANIPNAPDTGKI